MSLLHNHNNMQDKSHRKIELQQDRVGDSRDQDVPGSLDFPRVNPTREHSYQQRIFTVMH